LFFLEKRTAKRLEKITTKRLKKTAKVLFVIFLSFFFVKKKQMFAGNIMMK
jgi:hypothetical protein